MKCRKSLQKRLPDWVDEIWKENAPKIYKLCLQKCECKEEADDLFQEVALRFCRNADTLDISTPLFPWLSTVMFRCRSDSFKRKMLPMSSLCDVKAEYGCDIEDMIPDRNLDGELDSLSIQKELSLLMLELTAYERMLVELSVIGGMTLEEISRILGISKGSVARRRQDAFEKMREKMKLQGDEFSAMMGRKASLRDIIENAG